MSIADEFVETRASWARLVRLIRVLRGLRALSKAQRLARLTGDLESVIAIYGVIKYYGLEKDER